MDLQQAAEHRSKIAKSNLWVVKIGSALITNQGIGLCINHIEHWVKQVATLLEQKKKVVIVSSGATAEGFVRLGWQQEQIRSLHKLQAAAAIGQMGLAQLYEQSFKKYGILTAQILLTHEDIANRQRYLNARSTLKTLLDLNVIPIVNENDTVATQELRLGENDTLAGLVANLLEANLLVILTDQQGLYENDPRTHHNPQMIEYAQASDPTLKKSAGGSGTFGRGGMITKLKAATIAERSGTNTIIANGTEERVLLRIAQGENIGTLLYSNAIPINARRRWLAGQESIASKLYIDNGAVKALVHSGKSLLSVGVKHIEGNFHRGTTIACFDENGSEVARGLTNYSSEEIRKVLGKPSEMFGKILGYSAEPELIHRDNMIIISKK